MLLGFQDRFVPFVEDGSKRHTIRAGNRWKAGMRADLYARPRQKDMRLLFRAPVVKVEPIHLGLSTMRPRCWRLRHRTEWSIPSPQARQRGNRPSFAISVVVDSVPLGADERDLLFWRDGFRDEGLWPAYQALKFWKRRLPFTGQLIHWDYDRRTK